MGKNADTLLLGAGIKTTDVQIVRESDDLLLKLIGNKDTLRVSGFFAQEATTPAAIETLVFADNTKWDIAMLKAKALVGTEAAEQLNGYTSNDVLDGKGGDDQLTGNGGNDSLLGGLGNDQLYGGTGNDTLDGGAGDDYLVGDAGADTYLFGKGSGNDTLVNTDNDALGKNADTVKFGMGITAANLQVIRDSEDLLLKLIGTTDSLRVSSFFNQNATTAAAVESFLFVDNTKWDINMIKAKSVTLAAKMPLYDTDFSATVDVSIIENFTMTNEFTFEEKFPTTFLIESIF